MTSQLAFQLVVLASLMSFFHAVEVETTPPFIHQLYVPQVRKKVVKENFFLNFSFKIENPRTLVVDSAGHIIVGARRTGNITAIR